MVKKQEKEMSCMSCGMSLLGDEKFVQFPCPNCGKTIIYRCSKCKTLSNEYACSKCGFVGP